MGRMGVLGIRNMANWGSLYRSGAADTKLKLSVAGSLSCKVSMAGSIGYRGGE